MNRLDPESFQKYITSLTNEDVKRIDVRLHNLHHVEKYIRLELDKEQLLEKLLRSARKGMLDLLTNLRSYETDKEHQKELDRNLQFARVPYEPSDKELPFLQDTISGYRAVDGYLMQADRLIEDINTSVKRDVIVHLKKARSDLGRARDDLKRLLKDLEEARR